MRFTTSIAFVGAAVVVASFPGCSTGEEPAEDEDEQLCTSSGVCRPKTCKDKKRNDDETGVDCGGPCGACDGAACKVATDCSSRKCTAGVCGPAPTKTCGVGLPNPCADGQDCQQDIDCTSDYCDGKCVPPPPNVHEDGRRNGGETGKDCGGTAKDKPCPGGEGCKTDDDCLSVCSSGTCAPPSATDKKRNQGETDIDCGGPTAPKCLLGKVCLANADCQLDYCKAGTCDTPSITDGIKNGGETDIDCGGPGVSEGSVSLLPPRCTDLKACANDPDCVSGSCSPGGKCVARSCDTAETAGITTCGTGEPGSVIAAHESCCKSLKLPTVNKRLDKYEITAGRFRTFLDTAGPNVRQFVDTYVASKPGSQLAALVTTYPIVRSIYPATKTGSLGLVGHMALDIDNYSGIRGCYNGIGSYAHNTYWQPDTDLDDYQIPPRPLMREQTDAKSLNCAMPLMFAAFCAWDGGELATRDEILDAWGPGPYPWGSSPVPQTADNPAKPSTANYNWCNGNFGTGGFKCQNEALGFSGMFYRFPGSSNLANDESPLIAAPGRFPLDASALKDGTESWMDLFGNLVEITGDFTGTDNFCDLTTDPGGGPGSCTRNDPTTEPASIRTGTLYANVPRAGLVGRSFEGHAYERGAVKAWPSTGQYGKFGGRCVRPVQ